jgi:hypothetical protein
MPLHIIAGIFIGIVAVAAAGAAVSWILENFAESAAVRAAAKGFRRFFVTVLRTINNIVKFVAKSASGYAFFSDTMSYDDYDSELDIEEEYRYDFEANDDSDDDDYDDD